MDRHELEEKTKPDLIAMGAAVGIILTPAKSKGDMIDMLLGAPPAEKSTTDAEMPREGALRTLDGELVESSGKVRLTIMATETEKGDVFLGLNGHGLQIKRGIPVVIPVEYLSCLNDSTIYTVSKDPETGRSQEMQIMRHPYTATPV